MSHAADCERMVQQAEAAYGRLDVLFNNAGISHHADADAIDTEEEVWDLTMAVNLKGVFLGCKYGIPGPAPAPVAVRSSTPLLSSPCSERPRPNWPIPPARAASLALTRELAVHPRPRKHPRQRTLPRPVAHRTC